MRRWLKKYFIPHHKNGHHPHFLRKEGRLFVLATVLILQAALTAFILLSSSTNFLADIFPDVLVSEANTSRVQENLYPLVSNPVLASAAKLKAEDMARNGYFAHVSPTGITPWYWLEQAGYKFSYAGENLAVNFFDSRDLAEAWMESPLHRANIMNDKFTEIGIATASGIYNDRETVFVVQFFGRPASAATIAQKPQTQVSGSTQQEKFISTGSGDIRNDGIGPVPTSQSENQEPQEFIQKVVSSPRRTINYIQFILLAIVLAAILLAAFVEIKVQRMAPLMSGFLLVAIISGVVYVNHLIATISQIF